MRFDVDVIIKGTEAENAGVTAKGEEVADMTATDSEKIVFLFNTKRKRKTK